MEKVGALTTSPGSVFTVVGTSWAILHRRRGSPGASLLPFPFPRGYHVGDRPHGLSRHHTAQSALEAPTLSLHRTTQWFWGCCPFASWVMSGLGHDASLESLFQRYTTLWSGVPPGDPWHDENHAVSTVSPRKEGFILLVRTWAGGISTLSA